jgi:hypothetical protein
MTTLNGSHIRTTVEHRALPHRLRFVAAQRPKGLVNGHVGDPVVIEFIECATRKRRGIPAMSQTAGSGL